MIVATSPTTIITPVAKNQSMPFDFFDPSNFDWVSLGGSDKAVDTGQ